MELLKNLYSPEFITHLSNRLAAAQPEFSRDTFISSVLDDEWEARELKQRMRHITEMMYRFLVDDFENSVGIMCEIASDFQEFESSGLLCIIFPDFVELYGQDYPEKSLAALKYLTEFGSSEFAIRPFIQNNTEDVMSIMMDWAGDDNEHVRRLASEGCRSRLPWGMQLSGFVKDPSLVLPILERLKSDESLYVRRSVANNLNDISKDNPDIVIDIVKRWQGISPDTDWLLKHGCRTLLKKGHKDVLPLFDFHPISIEDTALDLSHPVVKMGETLTFSFSATFLENQNSKLRLEYVIDFVKKSGKRNGKVFQLREQKTLPSQIDVSKSHSFKNLSTRKHYAGMHKITIVVNGKAVTEQEFELTL